MRQLKAQIARTLVALCIFSAGLASADDSDFAGTKTFVAPQGTTAQLITAEQATTLHPQAVASQFAHMYKLSSRDSNKQALIDNRLQSLGRPIRNLDLDHAPVAQAFFNNDTTQRFTNFWTGLQARAFINDETGRLTLAFAGTEFSATSFRTPATFYNVAMAAWGSYTTHFTYAADLCHSLKSLPDVKDVVVTGNSLGGAVAQFVGYSCDVPVVAFNSLTLSPYLKKDALADQEGRRLTDAFTPKGKGFSLTLVNVEGEYLNKTDADGNLIHSWLMNSHPPESIIITVPPAAPEAQPWKRHQAGFVTESLEAVQSLKHQEQ